MTFAYCLLEEVNNWLPSVTIAASGTQPTIAQAEAIMADVAAEIDGELRGRGYALPVTDEQTLAYLKTVNIYGACAGILHAKFPTEPAFAQDWEARYQNALQAIRAGTTALDQGRSSSSVASGFDPEAEPIVTRDQEF